MDLPGEEYVFPQDVAITCCRPDMVIWSQDFIALIELTVSDEFEGAWKSYREEEGHVQ